jgi:iron complex outermembrane receptor protein
MGVRSCNRRREGTRSSSRRPWHLPVLALVHVGAAAHAEELPGIENSANQLEEITVTATKRSESLQEVPLSITAITNESIERAGILDFFDYALKVPNLTFASGQGIVAGQTVAIRGVQGTNATGFYIDDMPVPTTLDPRVIDLERIEVLRGPQGTLYGALSMGGAIKMITQSPELTSFSGKIHTIGSRIDGRGGGYQVDGSLNVPLVTGQAALRLNAFGGNDGTFLDRSFPDPNDPTKLSSVKVARKDFAGGMASLLWKVSDNFSVRPTILMQTTSMNGWPLSDVTAATLAQTRPLDVAEPIQDKWVYGGVTLSYATPVGDITSATSWFSRQSFESEDASEQIALSLGTPLLPAPFLTWEPEHSFVEELRFSSRFSGPLQFVTGIFVEHSESSVDQYSNVAGLDTAAGGALGTDLVFNAATIHTVKQSAAFGELTYQLAPRWSATVGVRYSHIETAFDQIQSGIAAAGYSGGQGSETEHKITPKVALQYEPYSNTTYYALASSGFRPGNAQIPPPPDFCASDYTAAGLTAAQIARYKSDSLWNYELGAKSRLLDRRFSINSSIYWIDWTDLQQTERFSCGYGFTTNAGKARSRGAELEMELSPLSGLTLTAGVGYTDAKITQSSALAQTRAGKPVQQIAPWTVSASIDYSFPLTGSWRGILRADNSYVDRSYSANNNALSPRPRPAYDIADFRFGAGTERLEVIGFIDNLANSRANLGDNQSQAAELPGRPRILVNQPRTYGASLTVHF